jgi:hypothetical protein
MRVRCTRPLAGRVVALEKVTTLHLPESWTERLPLLEALEDDWQPVPRAVLILAAAFYVLFLSEAARGSGPLLMMDLVFVPVHEGGHLLFRFFGQFLLVAGGTILQLGVPLMLAAYFIFHRHVQGTAFCVFFFFEQFLPVSTYMADARARELPLLTVGSGDDVIHDWAYLFGRLGVLAHDTQIAHDRHRRVDGLAQPAGENRDCRKFSEMTA